MGSPKNPKRYSDASYQAAHDDTYAHPLHSDIPEVLPPGVSRQDFDSAMRSCAEVLGETSTIFAGRDLKEFVDPYDLPEEGCEKRVPGAAIWYVKSIALYVVEFRNFYSQNMTIALGLSMICVRF